MAKSRAWALLALMLLAALGPIAAAGGRSSGVDLSVTDTSFAYTTSGDEGKYRMFSSNHPIPGFNRPESLYVIDAMVNVPIELSVTVTNGGAVSSVRSDVRVLVLHDEYDRFEIANVTEPLNPISGGSSGIVDFVFTPTYAGNHSLQVHVLQPSVDDNPTNDMLTRRITVGARYWNCDSLSNWTANGEWGLNSDTSISMGSSCHAGNGDGSTYSANTVSRLNTPLMDLSDAVASGTRTMGLTFFYTGWVVSPDEVSLEARTAAGGWEELASFSPTVDNNFQLDGSNWNTFSLNSGGYTSPLIPIAPDRHLHAGSSFRWSLTSDASSEDIGFWFDETVLVYDQAARAEAYGLTVTGLGTQGAVPGGWGEVNLRVTNSGNISTNVRPGLDGLPTAWTSYTLFSDGSSVPSTGFNLLPGGWRDVQVRLQPDENASVGFTSLTFNASTDHPNVFGTAPIGFTVLADRIPVLHAPEPRPMCPPEQTCAFAMSLSNEGAGSDVFDLAMDTSSLPQGWEVGFAWAQDESVLVRPGESVAIDLLLTVPEGAPADTTSTFTMHATAQNDSTRVSSIDVDVVAAMVSDISIEAVDAFPPLVGGGTSSISVEVTNNAGRMDVLNFEAEFESEGTEWVVAGLSRDQAVVAAQSSTTIRIDIVAPNGAKASDVPPRVRVVVSSERSGMTLVSSWYDGPEVTVVNGATLETSVDLLRVTPTYVADIPLYLNSTSNDRANIDIAVRGLPLEWSWWTKLDDVNATSPISVEPEGEVGSRLLMGIAVLAPVAETAGSTFTATIVASHDGVELASLDIDAMVMVVRELALELLETDRDVSSGSSLNVSGQVLNLGNAPEPRLSLQVDVQSTPPLEGLVAFVTTSNGVALVLGGANPMSLSAGVAKAFTVDLVVPEDAPLGARIVVNVRFDGGVGDDGLPYVFSESHLFEVSSRRELRLDVESSSNTTAPSGEGVPMSVHVQSWSSFAERLTLTFDAPDSWTVVCDGFGDASDGLTVDLDPGHIVLQERLMPCTVLQGDGPREGQVTVELHPDEGPSSYAEQSIDVSWAMPEEEASGLSSTALYGGLGGMVVLLAIISMSLIVRGRRSDESSTLPVAHDDPHTKHHPTAEVPVLPMGNSSAPPLPSDGLPPGWTVEQWQHYGHQWLAQQNGPQ